MRICQVGYRLRRDSTLAFLLENLVDKVLGAPLRAGLILTVILVVGLLQIIGYSVHIPLLKGVGFASAIAPFPKVFSDVEGLEPFASEFTLVLTSAEGAISEVPINAELYAHLAGPYNRRNVYGAALSYAPRLSPAIWQQVFCYAFYHPGVLRAELNIPQTTRHIAVRVKTKTRGRDSQWLLDAPCAIRSDKGDQ